MLTQVSRRLFVGAAVFPWRLITSPYTLPTVQYSHGVLKSTHSRPLLQPRRRGPCLKGFRVEFVWPCSWMLAEHLDALHKTLQSSPAYKHSSTIHHVQKSDLSNIIRSLWCGQSVENPWLKWAQKPEDDMRAFEIADSILLLRS
jgi:hypothetical protein